VAGTLKRQLLLTWEILFHWAAHLKELKPGETHLFYIARRRYIGRGFTVDGVAVRLFDKVVELHMNNEMIKDIVSREPQLMAVAVRILQETRRSLPVLAEMLNSSEYDDIKALYGVTLINRGLDRFGLSVFPLRGNLTVRLTNWHLKNIFELINPAAKRLIAEHPESFEPKLVAASRDHFIATFRARMKPTTHQSVPEPV
jgi:hypothetical protein